MRLILARGAIRGPISGADETLITYAGHLRHAGHEVSVLVLYPPASSDPYVRRLHDQHFPIISLARMDAERGLLATRALAHHPALERLPAVRAAVSRGGRRVLTGLADRYSAACRERLDQSGADLLHVLGQDFGAAVIIRAAHGAGVPVLYQDLGAGTGPSKLSRLASSMRLCAEVAALSPRPARTLREGLLPETPMSVLPIITDPPADHARVSPGPRRDLTFGFAGRLDRSKGPMEMVHAFAAVQTQFSGTRLRVAGAGPEGRRLMTLAKQLGIADRCQFTGVYDTPVEKTSFMRSIDVLVLPSMSEGTPNSIVEAMAHGIPVVSTYVGGIPDVVTPAVGILIPPGDSSSLADAMTRLASDAALRARMGAAATERYETTFSPAAVMPLLLRTYRRVAGGDGTVAALPAPADTPGRTETGRRSPTVARLLTP